jgi:hypothetical protein
MILVALEVTQTQTHWSGLSSVDALRNSRREQGRMVAGGDQKIEADVISQAHMMRI